MYHESFWRMPYVAEGIACNEHKPRFGHNIKHTHLLRLDNLCRRDAVVVSTCAIHKPDVHARFSFSKQPEVGVPVSRDAHCAEATWICGSGNVTGPLHEAH